MPLLKLLFVKVTHDRLTFLFLVTKAQINFSVYLYYLVVFRPVLLSNSTVSFNSSCYHSI